MPLTPSCQPSPQTTMERPPLKRRSASATASSVREASISRRSVLVCSRAPARRAASAASSVMRRSKATSTEPMRPAALSLGMIENGSESDVTCERSTPAVAARATMPGRRVLRRQLTPSATSARFSALRSIMSEIVPRQATSV